MAKALVDGGTNLTLKNKEGWTPLDMARVLAFLFSSCDRPPAAPFALRVLCPHCRLVVGSSRGNLVLYCAWQEHNHPGVLRIIGGGAKSKL